MRQLTTLRASAQASLDGLLWLLQHKEGSCIKILFNIFFLGEYIYLEVKMNPARGGVQRLPAPHPMKKREERGPVTLSFAATHE